MRKELIWAETFIQLFVILIFTALIFL